jgi:CRISPR-associated endoribonuclease Cas6
MPDKIQASSWARIDSYQELSAPYLLSQITPARQISLQFTSPTTFKSGGKHIPLPLPELVFGSLLERWNSFATICFPSEVKRYAAECLAISRYRLSSRVVPMKSGGLRMGAVGEITYTTLNYDRYWMSVINVLAEFALYSGVGAGSGMGLGQCRRIG